LSLSAELGQDIQDAYLVFRNKRPYGIDSIDKIFLIYHANLTFDTGTLKNATNFLENYNDPWTELQVRKVKDAMKSLINAAVVDEKAASIIESEAAIVSSTTWSRCYPELKRCLNHGLSRTSIVSRRNGALQGSSRTKETTSGLKSGCVKSATVLIFSSIGSNI
jgi:hypothetical protein